MDERIFELFDNHYPSWIDKVTKRNENEENEDAVKQVTGKKKKRKKKKRKKRKRLGNSSMYHKGQKYSNALSKIGQKSQRQNGKTK